MRKKLLQVGIFSWANFIPVQGQALQKYAPKGHKMIQKQVISDIA